MNPSVLMILITLGSAATLPIIVDDNFYDKFNVIYTSQHDIVNIFMPACSAKQRTKNLFLFFVEADHTNGNITYQGLYVMKYSKDFENITKLVLENGKDVTCDEDNIYIGAKDGIYTFNEQEMKAEKYGSVTKNIKNIEKVNGSDLFYILTEDNQFYRVTEYGNKITLDDTIVDAQQIVLDARQNLYYYLSNYEVWIVSEGVKTKIESLPKETFYLRLLKPYRYDHEIIPISTNSSTIVYFPKGITIFINNSSYGILPNGSVVNYSYVNILVKPTAYSDGPGLIQFFGHKKRIYLYRLNSEMLKMELTHLVRRPAINKRLD